MFLPFGCRVPGAIKAEVQLAQLVLAALSVFSWKFNVDVSVCRSIEVCPPESLTMACLRSPLVVDAAAEKITNLNASNGGVEAWSSSFLPALNS